MTLANLRWSYLWHKCSRKWDSQPEDWFGRSIEEPVKSWLCLSMSTRGHFWTNTRLNRSEVFKCVYSVGLCFVYRLQYLPIYLCYEQGSVMKFLYYLHKSLGSVRWFSFFKEMNTWILKGCIKDLTFYSWFPQKKIAQLIIRTMFIELQISY